MNRVSRAEVVSAVPALAALGVTLLWATDQGGYFPHSWYPGAIVLLAVLTLAAAADGESFRGLPRVTLVAIGAFVAYAGWGYLSITWADAPGPAWDAANQTLLYVVAFVLFSRRPASGRSAAVVAGAWAAAMALLAAIVLLKLPGTIGDAPRDFGSGLEAPFGYSNANAAAWLMAVWPALMLAASPQTPPWLRGVFAAAIVVLADTAVLSDSRGAFVATGIVLLALFALVPGRVRTLLTALPAAVAVALTAPHLLDLAQAAEASTNAVPDLGDAAAPVLLGALAVGVVVAIAATIERRRPPDEAAARDARRIVAVVAIGIAVGGAAVGLVAIGDPVDSVRDVWHDFKDTGTPRQSATYDAAGFGGARYDYYRVALDLFRDHPVAGIGAGNFAEDYLARGKVGERPTSPHSLELRALVQGGIVGAALLALALGVAFAAAIRALAAPGLGRAVAAGGLFACLYWVVDGSVDWFWEFPAMAVPALALLGLAGAVGRADAAVAAPRRFARPFVAVGVVAGLGAAASLALPYLAEREVRKARDTWTADAPAAFRQLDRAADLNPLSAEPHIAAGQLAVSLGRLDKARAEYREALDDDPRSLYATRALGAIASRQGRRAEALRLLRRALKLAPADPPTVSAIDQARSGRVDLGELERRISELAGQMVQ